MSHSHITLDERLPGSLLRFFNQAPTGAPAPLNAPSLQKHQPPRTV